MKGRLSMKKHSTSWRSYLKDVLICSLGAYGGPEAHYGVFTDQLVSKKKYLSEEELIELIALTGILPGPSSTQTIVAIGHKLGGPWLALLTMLVWSLPVLIVMSSLSFADQFLHTFNLSPDGLRYVAPMALGFILFAASRLNFKLIKSTFSFIIVVISSLLAYMIREPWIYPLILIGSGCLAVLWSKEKKLWNHVKLNPPWVYFNVFASLAIGSFALNLFTDNLFVELFETFYRFGYLVIGGGQVVVPFMYTELVEVKEYIQPGAFLTGYGLVQGLPGPMFSFSAFVGGIATSGGSFVRQWMGAMISGLAIFLPGLLLIYFVYPIWEKLKGIKGIKVALKGITAAAAGLINTAAIILMQQTGFQLDFIIITALTVFLLMSKKIPAPLIVIFVLLAGFII